MLEVIIVIVKSELLTEILPLASTTFRRILFGPSFS